MSKAIKLIISIVICQLAGVIGAFFTSPNISGWYAGLVKPAFNPPSWIFGPVWTTLFLLMGIAFYFIWQKANKNKLVRFAMIFFIVHLVFNTLWSILFFGLQNPGLAFLEIIILLAMIILLVEKFAKIDKRAAWLLVPYLLWVSFASILNYSIWQLNL
jgi:translocator protein